MLKKIGKTIYWILLIVLFAIAGLTAFSALDVPGNYKLMVVMSGSMEPAIKTGSIVVVSPVEKYQENDVITFENNNNPADTTTHRIVEVSESSAAAQFITKGDANNANDASPVLQKQILGKVTLAIPYAGYVINYTKTLQGLVLLIIIPAIVIIVLEIQSIFNEIKRMRNKKSGDS